MAIPKSRSARLALFGLGAAAAARLLINQARRIDLAGKVALITGGSRGLGLVLARRLIARGAHVAICARDPDEVEIARQELADLASYNGVPIHAAECDITDRDQVAEMVHRTQVQLGPIDILINNAGIIAVGPAGEMTLEDYDLAMRTHFWGAVYPTLAVLPSMRARGRGRIATISSIGGKVPVPHLVPYCASKFAVAGFSASLRAEAVRDGVYITTVYPGLMRTGSHLNATFKGKNQEEYAWFKWSSASAAIAAQSAADQILRAIAVGRAQAIIGLPAILAARTYDLAPEWTSDALALIAQALPTPGGIGREYAKGAESESKLTRSPLMHPLDRAARENNELP